MHREAQTIRSTGVALACVLAAALAAAGCGGGGGGGGGDPLTREQFAAKADAICNSADSEFTRIRSQLQSKLAADPAGAQPATADALREIAPVVKETVGKIGELKPPADLQFELDEYVSQANEAADLVAKDPVKFATTAASGQNPFPRLGELGKKLGLDKCGPSGG
jgi:hypothetical protein